MRGVHGEKLVALLDNEKLPQVDISRVHETIATYDRWISDLNNVKKYKREIEFVKKQLESYQYGYEEESEIYQENKLKNQIELYQNFIEDLEKLD